MKTQMTVLATSTKQNETAPFIRGSESKILHAFLGHPCGYGLSLFSTLNVPVFWPILVMTFIMSSVYHNEVANIKHMIKYRYIPFTLGKR